ncbi:hypothetical protein GN109_06050 [Collimonas pratensis]|uniref:hypothetical protein n=1 Tax=Collimonas pratensis TaxID=279113 RepID=UPI00143DA1E3|nr:hypothetical protein [Collimonas pratensis]NKI68976.1 hypothetical protein [Collimonas pratensis]
MSEPTIILWVVQGLLAVLCSVLGWNFKTLRADVVAASTEREAVNKDLQAYKLHVAETYVTQTDLSKAIDNFGKAIEAVFKKLERIEDKLDMKADK